MKRTLLQTKRFGLVAFIIATCACLCVAFCLAGCSGNSNGSTQYKSNYQPLDYSLDANWYKKDVVENSDYDLVFFVGTSSLKPNQENGVNTEINESTKANALNNYSTVGSQLSASGVNTQNASVYVPAYRQMAMTYALDTYTGHDQLPNDLKTKEPGADIYAALDYYFTNINKDGKKPFVIAGHSQGSAAVQFALEEYFINSNHKDYLTNLVAMYSTGYGVSEKWFNGLDKKNNGKEIIHFATGADDTGCLISWNIEGPGEKSSSILLADKGDKTLVVNPLNWKTDSTYAGIEQNEGVLATDTHVITAEASQLFDGQIDAERGSVICTTNQNYFAMPGYDSIFGGKSLHTYDGPGYYVNMGTNLHNRLVNFLAAKK